VVDGATEDADTFFQLFGCAGFPSSGRGCTALDFLYPPSLNPGATILGGEASVIFAGAPVPEPASIALFSTGLFALGPALWRRRISARRVTAAGFKTGHPFKPPKNATPGCKWFSGLPSLQRIRVRYQSGISATSSCTRLRRRSAHTRSRPSAFVPGMGLRAPNLPLAIPVGIGSIGSEPTFAGLVWTVEIASIPDLSSPSPGARRSDSCRRS
jgi:hypothetical protein